MVSDSNAETTMKRVIAVILLAAQLVGCYRWQPTSLAPKPAAESQTVHTRIRVRNASGQWIELTDARREGDSIHAKLPDAPFRDTTFALVDTTAVEEAKLDSQKLTIVALVTVAVVGLAAIIASSMPDYTWIGNTGGILGP